MKNRITSIIMYRSTKKASLAIICLALTITIGTGSAFAINANTTAVPDSIVSFSDPVVLWDTGWGDDEYFINCHYDSSLPVSEYGIKVWDRNGYEINYIDGPSQTREYYQYLATLGAVYSFPEFSGKISMAIEAIDNNGSYYTAYPDGSRRESLIIGETYYCVCYVICDGTRYETQVNSFVFSTVGARFGNSVSH